MAPRSSTQTIPSTSGLPRHVAIIMDGNGRWATSRFLPRTTGHTRGVKVVRKLVEECGNRGIEYLTLFAFSSENWRRPASEVGMLMRLFVQTLEREVDKLHERGVRLRVVGDLSAFEPRLQALIQNAEERTAGNSQLHLTIAANYGGRWDVLQAMRCLLRDQPTLAQTPDQLSEAHLMPYLKFSFAPEPDLFIRTGGEQRISNFMIWQLAYTELYFTPVYWPDFSSEDLEAAIRWYQGRERRFGRTSAQLAQ